MQRRIDGKDIWVRKFEVSSPGRHKKGFTLYKIVSTVFPKSFPDGATKITVWKRYKDLKKLHSELEKTFAQLYLNGNFPKLPKDKLFSARFEPEVIEERRKAALELLDFTASYSQLFTNSVFVKFFEDGYSPRDIEGSEVSTEPPEVSNVLVEDEDLNFKACLVPEKVWNLPALEQECVGQTDEDSSPSFSCASSEFGNGHTGTPIHEKIASSQVINTAGASAASEKVKVPPPKRTPNLVTFSDTDAGQAQATCSNYNPVSLTTGGPPAPLPLSTYKEAPFMGSTSSLTEDLDYLEQEFDFSKNESRLVNSASTFSLNTLNGFVPHGKKVTEPLKLHKPSSSSMGGFNLLDFLPIFTKNSQSGLEQRTSNQNLSSSYLKEAAGFFSLAQNHESNCEWESALEAYTEGVRILLEGAQSDGDCERQMLAKKKVQKYLTHAENLKRMLQKQDCVNIPMGGSLSSLESRSDDGYVILENNVTPSYMEDLKNYKIVGYTHNNVLIAVDITSQDGPDCFAIKVLRKSASIIDPEKPSIIPSTIPFMVKLIKWFNSEDTIILVLQYAAGGRLIDFVRSYQTKNIAAVVAEQPSSSKVVCSCGTTSACNLHAEEPCPKSPRIEGNCSGRGFENAETLANPKADDIAGETDAQNETLVSNENITEVGSSTELPYIPESSSSTEIPLYNFGTETLIENSLALLKVVSKTLDDQKKSPNLNMDLSEALVHSDLVLLKNDARPAPISDGIPMKSNSLTFAKPDQVLADDNPLRIIPERCLKIWAAELVIALGKLHSQGITYGDLDIHNILLGDNGHVLLSYRALWNEIDIQPSWNDFSAPEVILNFGKSLWKTHPSADWWSLGAILHFLLTGLLIQETHPEGIHPQTVICIPSTNILGDPLSPEVTCLLIELLQYTPNLRLGYYGAEEIKAHPFFKDFDWAAAEQSRL